VPITSGGVPVAIISSSCTAAILLMLVVRGPWDWSDAFGTVWFGLFGLGVVTGVIGVLASVANRRPGRRRLLTLALSLAALIAVPLFFWMMATNLPYTD
jgi:hypothetical protein